MKHISQKPFRKKLLKLEDISRVFILSKNLFFPIQISFKNQI
jgi:hypothetical protein